MLATALSGSSIILGLFIIISYFSGGDPAKEKPINKTYEYHLGCYLTHQDTTKRAEFQQRLVELEENSRRIKSKIDMSPVQVK